MTAASAGAAPPRSVSQLRSGSMPIDSGCCRGAGKFSWRLSVSRTADALYGLPMRYMDC